MKVNEKFKVKVLQEGGNIPAEPATQAQPSPEQIFQQILQLAAQATQNQDCQAALAVCSALVEMTQGQAAQAEAPTEPVLARKGTKLVVKKRQ